MYLNLEIEGESFRAHLCTHKSHFKQQVCYHQVGRPAVDVKDGFPTVYATQNYVDRRDYGILFSTLALGIRAMP